MWVIKYWYFILLRTFTVESKRIKANIFADNWVRVWVNGREVYTDPIRFIPHNLNSFEFETGDGKLF